MGERIRILMASSIEAEMCTVRARSCIKGSSRYIECGGRVFRIIVSCTLNIGLKKIQRFEWWAWYFDDSVSLASYFSKELKLRSGICQVSSTIQTRHSTGLIEGGRETSYQSLTMTVRLNQVLQITTTRKTIDTSINALERESSRTFVSLNGEKKRRKLLIFH